MTDHDLVLVTGGGVSRLVIELLRAHDMPVRVLVRREDDRAAEMRALGAEVVTGGLTRPERWRPRSTASAERTSGSECPRTTCWRRQSWPGGEGARQQRPKVD